MSNYAPGGPKFGKVCKHAILERSCDECHDTLGTKAQLTTLIREVAAMRKWHDSVHMSILYDTDARRSMLNSREATDSNPDLQARIAAEMERE